MRAEEHITAIKSASKKSHTAEHCWKYNHDFDWKHKKVLDFEKNWKTRTIKESIYSEENEHHINGISFKLPNIWKPILRENKTKKTTAKTTTSSNWVRKGPRSCMVPCRSQFKINQSGTTSEYFDPLQTHNTRHTSAVDRTTSAKFSGSKINLFGLPCVYHILPKLLHDSTGLPYVKDCLFTCATKSLDRIAQNPPVGASISSNKHNPAWDRFPTPLSVVRRGSS